MMTTGMTTERRWVPPAVAAAAAAAIHVWVGVVIKADCTPECFDDID